MPLISNISSSNKIKANNKAYRYYQFEFLNFFNYFYPVDLINYNNQASAAMVGLELRLFNKSGEKISIAANQVTGTRSTAARFNQPIWAFSPNGRPYSSNNAVISPASSEGSPGNLITLASPGFIFAKNYNGSSLADIKIDMLKPTPISKIEIRGQYFDNLISYQLRGKNYASDSYQNLTDAIYAKENGDGSELLTLDLEKL